MTVRAHKFVHFNLIKLQTETEGSVRLAIKIK